MSPIEIANIPGDFADASLSPVSVVESLETQVVLMQMSEHACDAHSIITEYDGKSSPARMINTPAPGRSILRKISKYDQVAPSTTPADRIHNVPIVSAESVLPFSESMSQNYPVKVRRMSNSGVPMSSAAAIFENLKSALKLSSRKSDLSLSSSAASSTTSLTEEPNVVIVKAPRNLRFNGNVLVGETFHAEDYDRTPGEMIAKKLTAQVATMIKKELNDFKSRDMIVHDESRHNTVYYPL